MKKINLLFCFGLLAVIAISCSKKEGIDDDLSFLNTSSTSNMASLFDISDDNSGIVKITPTGEGASSFTIDFGHASASETIMPGHSATHAYPEGSYTVNITSTDIAGKTNTNSFPLQLTYRAPENLQINIASDMQVSATALYANSFLVYYGDVANEVGTPLAVGQTLPAHIYPAGGPYDLRVVAQSGGAATTQATKTLFGFPLSFESPTMDYFFGTFGDVQFTKVASPDKSGLNTSEMVGKYFKPVGAPSWSGTYSPLNIPINFTQGKKIKVMVYNPDPANVGKKLNVELEWAIGASDANPWGAVLRMPITTSGAWEELEFDFSSIAAIPATARFTQLVLRFNDSADGAGETIYVDNFRLTN
ncbi:MAG: hypothetical protein H0V30_15925 [Chitinophagaceae bacterium]|jgi:hypothetical protein|nr:hypothetical protein [Chitinophagaceae bacterium]